MYCHLGLTSQHLYHSFCMHNFFSFPLFLLLHPYGIICYKKPYLLTQYIILNHSCVHCFYVSRLQYTCYCIICNLCNWHKKKEGGGGGLECLSPYRAYMYVLYIFMVLGQHQATAQPKMNT